MDSQPLDHSKGRRIKDLSKMYRDDMSQKIPLDGEGGLRQVVDNFYFD